MKKMIALLSLTLVALVFTFSGNAWAGRGHDRGHRYEKHHRYDGAYGRQHRGWHKGYGHRVERHRYSPPHRFRHHPPGRRIVEKHIYHYDRRPRHDRGFRHHAAGSLWHPGFYFSFGVSGHR